MSIATVDESSTSNHCALGYLSPAPSPNIITNVFYMAPRADRPPVEANFPSNTAGTFVFPSSPVSASDTTKSPRALSPSLQRLGSPSISITGIDQTADILRSRKRARLSPVPMTAAAAMVDQQRLDKGQEQVQAIQTSPNPAKQALGALMGVNNSNGILSKAQSSPTPTNKISEPMSVVAESLQVNPDEMQVDSQAQTSPVSLSSLASLENSTVQTAPAPSSTVDSPASIDEIASKDISGYLSPEDTNKAFSYPGPALAAQLSDSRRGMSLPHSGLARLGSPKSPSSSKKHRCPYCSTEFTRHHNLKSHLLTHSQEKPYVCQTCQSRFRRLHDLKRHTKLHTGERPHICNKCGRRFARGDALARHNKGQGGCAGRRSSMGSYGGDDDYQEGAAGSDDHMDGLVYNEPDRMDDEEDGGRRQSMPSIKKHNAPAQGGSSQSQTPQNGFQQRQPSTYPPIQGRPPGGIAGGLFPPPASHGGGSSSSASPSSQGGNLALPQVGSQSSTFNAPAQGSAMFAQSAMTESPKPLSPGQAHQGDLRHRSPSLTTQFQQQHYGRGSSRRTPPVLGLPPPQASAPQLPHPHSLNHPPPDARYTLPSQGPTHPPAQPTGPPTRMSGGGLSSHSNSLSSHGQSQHGSGEGTANLYGQAADNNRLWAYVKSLEDKINSLNDEVTSLKGQLASVTQTQSR